MKISLLPFLLLGLPAAAQYRPMYSTPRPSYSPPPPSLYHPLTNPNVNYRAQQQQQQQAHQNFQQMQAQQRQQMQDQYYYRSRGQSLVLPYWQRRPLSAEQLEQAQTRQQQAEQEANAQVARLMEEQRQHQANPPASAEQAAAQRQEDARQLTQLTLTNYRKVFLPGQLLGALQTLLPTSQAQQQWHAFDTDLLDKTWWSQQPASQLAARAAASGSALTKLCTDLLGFNAASMPPAPAPRSIGALREQLSQREVFDQAAAAQLIQDATLAEKRQAGERLALAVQHFADVSNQVATNPAASPKALRQQRGEMQNSLRRVHSELARYGASVGNTGPLLQARAAIMQSTTKYLARNDK